MKDKINVLDIEIDDCTAKEAMRLAIEYMESEPLNIIELVTVDDLMELEDLPVLKSEMSRFDIILAADRTILEAADVDSQKYLSEVDDRIFLRMFLHYLAKKRKRVYLLVESEEEGQEVYRYLEDSYKGLQIVGIAKVLAGGQGDDMLVNAINGEEVDCILSTLSSPLQEEVVVNNRGLLNVRIWLGLGKGSLLIGQNRRGQGKLGQFLKKILLKKEIEKRKKRGN